ncbi:hypothetical protein GCM10027346_30340 [Hymenobacter seoulensis]
MPMRPLRYVAFVLLLAGTAACSGTQSASETTGIDAAAPKPRPVEVDVPALVGRNIDQVRRTLGTPLETRNQKVGLEPTPEQMKGTKGEGWINTFERNGTTLIATFNARTRKVRDLVVMGNNEEELLQKANLSLTATTYILLPVADPQNSRQIMGMRVVAKK